MKYKNISSFVAIIFLFVLGTSFLFLNGKYSGDIRSRAKSDPSKELYEKYYSEEDWNIYIKRDLIGFGYGNYRLKDGNLELYDGYAIANISLTSGHNIKAWIRPTSNNRSAYIYKLDIDKGSYYFEYLLKYVFNKLLEQEIDKQLNNYSNFSHYVIKEDLLIAYFYKIPDTDTKGCEDIAKPTGPCRVIDLDEYKLYMCDYRDGIQGERKYQNIMVVFDSNKNRVPNSIWVELFGEKPFFDYEIYKYENDYENITSIKWDLTETLGNTGVIKNDFWVRSIDEKGWNRIALTCENDNCYIHRLCENVTSNLPRNAIKIDVK